jgi:hypothetical protein
MSNNLFAFEPFSQPVKASPGIVLRIDPDTNKYLRITHVFKKCIFAIIVEGPERARYARRPFRISQKDFNHISIKTGVTWGRLRLPPSFSVRLPEERANILEASWELIKPIIKCFEDENNLSSRYFASLIAARANEMKVSPVTLRRMVIRYYYFGNSRLGLLPLPTGIESGHTIRRRLHNMQDESDPHSRIYRRRGPKSILTSELGENDFAITEDDINDMVECFKRKLRGGPTNYTSAHAAYVEDYFSKRHPNKYKAYLSKKCQEPITLRQFKYHVKANVKLTDDLAENLPQKKQRTNTAGSLIAYGPGEFYEIDATQGRIYLTAKDDPNVEIGKPTLYIIIDRWSRFVVSVYLSLAPMSWEEIRYAILIAFTSRNRRFRKTLGINIDDNRWPVGRFPAAFCADRGSENLCESLEASVVGNLKLPFDILPPFCPDGKGIVERIIREIKRRMHESKLKGTYAKRPLDPKTKKASKNAQKAAVHSLEDAYRTVISIVETHNNRPHRKLKSYTILSRNGVPPTPKEAYIWGLKNLTGLQTPSITDLEYQKMLLGIDTGSISNGNLHYRQRTFSPDNEPAVEIARKSTSKPKSITLRVDKSDPLEVFIETRRGDWARFVMKTGDANNLRGMTMDEEEAFQKHQRLIVKRAENDANVKRLKDIEENTKTKKSKRKNGTDTGPVSAIEKSEAREQETKTLKNGLKGKHTSPSKRAPAMPPNGWKKHAEEERRKLQELIKSNKGRH